MGQTIIVGGVAGGATAAARLRRLDETMSILVLEKGDYISYANCGLPYYIGDVIRDRAALLLQTPEAMRQKFNVDVRTGAEVTAIDRAAQTVAVRYRDGSAEVIPYDDLILATGSSPLKPPIPGIDGPGIYTLWTVPDTDRIRQIVDERRPRTAAVIGGGFIGLEMAENLHRRGIRISLIEAQDQVMAPLDFEMAQQLHANLVSNGVDLRLGDGVQSFEPAGDQTTITLAGGDTLTVDLVILSIGVRPNSQLARDAGLALNERGGVVVDAALRTSDPHIWAVGDVIQITNLVTGQPGMIPLAGPANKQGRIVAGNIAAAQAGRLLEDGQAARYDGTLGTAVAQVFDLTAASVGVNEKALKAAGRVKGVDYETVIVTQKSHAGYYPLAAPLIIKLLFERTGRILGAQAVGPDGVDKRIDVIAAAMRLDGTVGDLTRLELAYAPPYSSAKDPVNMAGFTAENVLNGLVTLWSPQELQDALTENRVLVLDVREAVERAAWAIEPSVHIPLGELRGRLGELPADRPICVYCSIGVRSYNAARVLMQNGFASVSVLAGGSGFYQTAVSDAAARRPAAPIAAKSAAASTPASAADPVLHPAASDAAAASGSGISGPAGVRPEPAPAAGASDIRILDCCGLQCPGPIMKVNEALNAMRPGEIIRVSATDMGFARDVESWCSRTGNIFLGAEKQGLEHIVSIQKGAADAGMADGMSAGRPSGTGMAELPQGKTLIVFDGDLDKVLASFIIANGAAAMGRPVTMFFTFWGLNVLRKSVHVPVRKSLVEKMFGFMMPRGMDRLKLSKLNMGGLGTRMMKSVMQKKQVSSLQELVRSAQAAGVKLIACTMSMDVMGIRAEELIDGVELGGVAAYLGDAERANVNLFI